MDKWFSRIDDKKIGELSMDVEFKKTAVSMGSNCQIEAGKNHPSVRRQCELLSSLALVTTVVARLSLQLVI
jgi:hypothetical protein